MTDLKICGLSQLNASCLEFDPDLVISITDPEFRSSLTPYLKYARQYYPLDFNDLDRLQYHGVAPGMDHLRDTKEMLNTRFPEGIDRLLVHCQMGSSRSPAMAIFALAVLATRSEPATPELARRIVDQVFEAAPEARPNMRIVEMTECTIEGFDYALIQAVRDRTDTVKKKSSRIARNRKIGSLAFRP